MLADIAVGRQPRSGGDRLQALDLLWYFARPWPVDRRLLLTEVKTVTLSEFDNERNLRLWAAWDEDAAVDWGNGPAYALTLYRILLAVATDGELRRPVEYLLRHARNPLLRSQVSRMAYRCEGVRLSSPRQSSNEEHVAHILNEQRAHRRDAGPQRTEDAKWAE